MTSNRRTPIECPACQQLIAWRLSSGVIVPVGARVAEQHHKDGRVQVRIECPRCGRRTTPPLAA